MATFHFDLVSPEKLAFSGEVDQVDVPGMEGDFGVMAGHAPVVAAIRPGILTITSGGTHQKIIVLGGLAEMSDKGLTVLADVATSTQDLDRAQFAETISEMEAKLAEKEGSELDRAIERLDHFKSIQQRAQRHRDALSLGFAPSIQKPDKLSARVHFAQQGRQPGQILQDEIGERGVGPAHMVAAPGPAFEQRGLHAETSVPE